MYTPCASVGVGVAAASALAVPSAMRDILIHMAVPPSVTSRKNTMGRTLVPLFLFCSNQDQLVVASSAYPAIAARRRWWMFGMVPVTIVAAFVRASNEHLTMHLVYVEAIGIDC